jgi:TonB family protein
MYTFKRYLVLLLLTAAPSLYAQADIPTAISQTELRNHIAYPERAVEDYIEGRLDSLLEGTTVITTVLRGDGGISSAEITTSAAPMLDSITLAAVLSYQVVSAQATGRSIEKSTKVIVRFTPYYTADSTEPEDTLIVGMSKQQCERVFENEKNPDFEADDLVRRVHYPEMARKNGIEGEVMVQVYIEKDGKIGRIRIVRSTNEIFNEEAIHAVQGVKFIPAQIKDRPIATWISIPIKFALQ